MFSELGKIYGRPPRHAESADTRAEIKRHEDEPRRRKDSEDEDKGFDDLIDHAEVSVSALRKFLADFVAGHISADPHSGDSANAENAEDVASQAKIRPKEKTDPDGSFSGESVDSAQSSMRVALQQKPSQAQQIQAQRAAHAYQSASQQSPYQTGTETDNATTQDSLAAQQQAAADMLGGEDVRRIHALISDLDILASRGVSVLEIRPHTTFLDGLIEAVKTALS